MNTVQRLCKHLWLDSADARRALPPDAQQRLAQAIAASERRHSGEIRICVEAALPWQALWPPVPPADWQGVLRRRALAWFGELGVWDTQHNNGVLIHLLLAERHIEIVADRGLHERVPVAHWQALTEQLAEALRQGRFEAGLGAVLDAVSTMLETHFPLPSGQANPNELPDAVVVV